jgi:hypothetical protein
MALQTDLHRSLLTISGPSELYATLRYSSS